MTRQQMISFIDEFLEANEGFLSNQMLDFALDMRSFVNTLDRETSFVEAA